MPAIVNSRYQARKLACQQNLTTWDVTCSPTATCSRASFPLVPLSGSRSFAGVFAPILLENDLLDAEHPQLICPGSELATDARNWSLPTLAEVDEAAGPRLFYLQDQAGGSYAYCVGYIDDKGLHPVENRGRSHFAILSDAPSFFLPDRRSAHHGGRGQNVLYEDGRMAFVTDFADQSRDHPWLNREPHAEAGARRSSIPCCSPAASGRLSITHHSLRSGSPILCLSDRAGSARSSDAIVAGIQRGLFPFYHTHPWSGSLFRGNSASPRQILGSSRLNTLLRLSRDPLGSHAASALHSIGHSRQRKATGAEHEWQVPHLLAGFH